MTNDNDKCDANDRTGVTVPTARGRRSAGARFLTRFAKRRVVGALLVPLVIHGAIMTAAKPLPAHGRYPHEMQVAFMAACEHKSGTADRPLCQCVLSKLEARYSATRLVEQMDDRTRIGLVERFGAQCAPVSDPAQVAPPAQPGATNQVFRAGFLASCERAIRADLKPICTCVLGKIEARYPTVASREALDEDASLAALKRFTAQCVRPVAPKTPDAATPVAATAV
jgi:hypothetical protein